MGRALSLSLLGLLATALPQSLAKPTTLTSDELAPSEPLARRRAPQIFNAVHHAMRQWGSSLHHNGMSYFIATVPAGVQFYHGNGSPDSPTGPDWLAYEIEHAEHFASGRGPGRGPPGKGGPGGHRKRDDDEEQQYLMGEVEAEDEEPSHGYLHVYRTTRPMQYLYVDGMGGGKTNMGTLDSQDYLLRGQKSESQVKDAEREREHMQREGDSDGQERNQELRRVKRAPGGPMDEQQRAIDLCKLAKEWNLSGIVRMEAGFEIIQCDFSDGLREIQALQRPDTGRGHGMSIEFIRGLSERYQGIGASRTVIDYSSMVSAFFFPVNLTNPDPKRPDLPRLSSTTDGELLAIKNYLARVVAERRGEDVRTIDWQDISDLIVGRYADRLKYTIEAADTVEAMASELDFLLTVFIDNAAPADKAAAIDRCTAFYMQVRPRTEADRLIQAAFLVVSRDICTTMFQARDLVVVNPAPDQKALSAASSALGALMDRLAWTRFKRCPACAIDEVCVIPMWPSGTVEQYNHPRCSNGTQDDHGDGYWGGWGGRPGGPGGGRGRGPPPM